MITSGLITYLLAQTAITAICSTRIYPASAPFDETFPALVIQQISGQEDITFDGALNMGKDRYQLTCWGSSYADAETLAMAVVANVNGLTTSFGSRSVYVIEVLDQRDMLSEASDPALRAYGKHVDIEIVRTS